MEKLSFLYPSKWTYRTRGKLPHLEVKEGVYFVTFRLGDSLPQHLLDFYIRRRRDIYLTARQLDGRIGKDQCEELRKLDEELDSYLDKGAGACWMKSPDVAKIVAASFQHHCGIRYRLFAWVVMPNHVHVLLQTLGDFMLDPILHSWKSFTAHEANRVLGRSGGFWQREYHDHLVRDFDDFYHYVRYTAQNPGDAGLKEWRWGWVHEELRSAVGKANGGYS